MLRLGMMCSMRSRQLLALVALLLPTASAAAAVSHGTLHGTVTRGPTSPVCSASVPCSAPVANTVITFTRAGITRSARTDLHGRYKIELPAGYYVIGTQVLMVGPPLRPAKVHVRAAHADEIDFTIDTGIR